MVLRLTISWAVRVLCPQGLCFFIWFLLLFFLMHVFFGVMKGWFTSRACGVLGRP